MNTYTYPKIIDAVTRLGGVIIGLHLANDGRPGDLPLLFIGGLFGFAKPIYMGLIYFGLEITKNNK
jgi:hypothetical protein